MASPRRNPLISAHRGECGVAGLPAAERYRRAIALGVDFIEFDVRKTADAVLMCYHDDRTPAGKAVSEASYEELRQELGPELLRLDELLDIAGGGVGLHVDLKEMGDELEVVDRVLERHTAAKVVFTSLQDSSIRKIKEERPQVTAGLSLGRDLDRANPIYKVRVRLGELFPGRRLRACRADFVAVHKQLAALRVLRWCSRHRVPAWIWTLEDEAELTRFLWQPAATAVITNRPDIARRLVASGPPALAPVR